MALHDFHEFLLLSAVLNLHWGSGPAGIDNVISVIVGGDSSLNPEHREVLRHVLRYLDEAYGQRRRRLGPLSVLHPLRSTAILSRVLPDPPLLDLLSELLHDKLEDIREAGRDHEEWVALESQFTALLKEIDDKNEYYLMERLSFLTRKDDETYYSYVGRLLDRSHLTPELVRVKLADRLDNCLDMRIALEDPMKDVDFFEEVFKLLFMRSYRGYKPAVPHPPVSPLNGAERLYQLFKNAVLLSLLRQKRLSLDRAAVRLFDALTLASMREAERIILHVSGYHMTDVQRVRLLLLDAMDYIQQGGLQCATLPGGRRLDGLLISAFDHTSSDVRKAKLKRLHEDKDLMLEAATAFLVVFQAFQTDPEYWLRGITDRGLSPTPSSLDELPVVDPR